MMDWFLRLSLRNRLIIYLFLGLIPIFIISIYSSMQNIEQQREQVLAGEMASAQLLASAVRGFIDGITRAQAAISITIAQKDMTYAEISEYLRKVREEFPDLSYLAFSIPSGEIVAGNPSPSIGENISSRQFFQEITSGRIWMATDLYYSPILKIKGFVIAHRVERDGKFIGVITSFIEPKILQGFVRKTLASPQTEFSIIDSTGTAIVSTVVSAHEKEAYPDRSNIPGVKKALSDEPSYIESLYDPTGQTEYMGAAYPVYDIGWVTSAIEPVSTALAPVRRTVLINLIVHAIIAIFLIALLWTVGSRLTKPIRSLAQKAGRVAEGDFSQQMESPDHAELGSLATAFNNMTRELQRSEAEQHEARDRAAFLEAIDELLISSLDPSKVLKLLVEKIAEYMGDLVSIIAMNLKEEARLLAEYARDAETLSKVDKLLSERPMAFGFGVVGTAVMRKKTLFIQDVTTLEDPNMRVYVDRLGITSTMAIPMNIHGEVVGALSISTIGRKMYPEIVPLAEEVARRLGIALENIRLYESTREREQFQESLTDLAAKVSSSLDPREVLDSICSHTLSLLKADGVYLWVIREDENTLYGSEACGHKAEEFIGTTIRLSDKSASTVHAVINKKGLLMQDVPHLNEIKSLLTSSFNAKSLMFQPLISAGTPLGVLVVSDIRDPKRFDETSLERSAILAGYAATALANARAYERERNIAETLQKSFFAEIPSIIDSFEIAHFYTSAGREALIGGDFYDWIKVSNFGNILTIGDVSGKGLEAAVVTAMAKYMIRAYAAQDPHPETVLSKANRAIYKYTIPELFITMISCLLDVRDGSVEYASAGHEPLILFKNLDKSVNLIEPSGIAAGVIPSATYKSRKFRLDPGDIMLMYTDGLTDARSPEGEFLGYSRLSEIVLELSHLNASEFLKALVAKVHDFVGGEFLDDVAILITRASYK